MATRAEARSAAELRALMPRARVAMVKPRATRAQEAVQTDTERLAAVASATVTALKVEVALEAQRMAARVAAPGPWAAEGREAR